MINFDDYVNENKTEQSKNLIIFITQSYFSVPKDVRLNSTHYLIIKISSRRELQNLAISYSADIDYKDFIKI